MVFFVWGWGCSENRNRTYERTNERKNRGWGVWLEPTKTTKGRVVSKVGNFERTYFFNDPILTTFPYLVFRPSEIVKIKEIFNRYFAEQNSKVSCLFILICLILFQLALMPALCLRNYIVRWKK